MNAVMRGGRKAKLGEKNLVFENEEAYAQFLEHQRVPVAVQAHEWDSLKLCLTFLGAHILPLCALNSLFCLTRARTLLCLSRESCGHSSVCSTCEMMQ